MIVGSCRLHFSFGFAGRESVVTPVRPASHRHIGQSFAELTADVSDIVRKRIPNNHRRRRFISVIPIPLTLSAETQLCLKPSSSNSQQAT